jgi:hypothetical protein
LDFRCLLPLLSFPLSIPLSPSLPFLLSTAYPGNIYLFIFYAKYLITYFCIQGTDPATDFRGMGLLGLEQLVYFAENHTGIITNLPFLILF